MFRVCCLLDGKEALEQGPTYEIEVRQDMCRSNVVPGRASVSFEGAVGDDIDGGFVGQVFTITNEPTPSEHAYEAVEGLKSQIAPVQEQDDVVVAIKSEAKLNTDVEIDAATGAWSIVVEKTDSLPDLGLTLDTLHGKLLQVNNVNDGAVKRYNMSAPQDMQIKPGAFIQAVNGKHQNIQVMLLQFRGEKILKLTFAPKEEFEVHFSKKNGKNLALDLHFLPENRSLIITRIGDGLVQEHNERMQAEGEPNRVIRRYDRIFEVNGTTGKASQLMDLLRSSDEVTLKMGRPILSP